MVDWTKKPPQTTQKRVWLRKIKLSFYLYRRLLVALAFMAIALFFLCLSYLEHPLSSNMSATLGDGLFTIKKWISKPVNWAYDVKGYMQSWKEARQEALRLRDENSHLRQQIQKTHTIRSQNEQLRRLLHVRQHIEGPFLTARVISYPGKPYVKNILIDAGKAHGVKKHQVALDQQGLVGHVINAGLYISRVLLITDLNSRIPVSIGAQHVPAILSGNNEDLPFLKYAKLKHIKVGDRVETSGEGSIFPARIPVGTVFSIEGEEALVKPFSPLKNLTQVILTEPVIESVIESLDHDEQPL